MSTCSSFFCIFEMEIYHHFCRKLFIIISRFSISTLWISD